MKMYYTCTCSSPDGIHEHYYSLPKASFLKSYRMNPAGIRDKLSMETDEYFRAMQAERCYMFENILYACDNVIYMR
jgi:hypothetical protein